MRCFLLIPFLLFLLLPKTYGQPVKQIEERLVAAFSKIEYWDDPEIKTNNPEAYDSLDAANATFEKLLLAYTASNPNTLSYKFKNLSDTGLIITTSEDGLFRIYSWNTLGGGSMQYYNTVFQYRNAKGTFSVASKENREQEKDPPGSSGRFYYQINDVVSRNKTFYITQSKAVLSSAYSYHNIKIFTIDLSGLNDTARLIRTKTGLRNTLGYEVELSAKANRDWDRERIPDYKIDYDPARKTITIPVILENYRITDKKIRYRFNGTYFEKK